MMNSATSMRQGRGVFFKTKACKFFAAGICSRGSECRYAHSRAETREQPNLYKTELCASFTFNGSCSKGDACVFAHGYSDVRNTPTGTSPETTFTSQNVLLTDSITCSNQRNAATMPHVAVPMHTPRVQIDCRVPASETGAVPTQYKWQTPWNASPLQQSCNRANLGVQGSPSCGALSIPRCFDLDDFKGNQQHTEDEATQAQADLPTMSEFDKYPYSSVDFDSDSDFSLDTFGADGVSWGIKTTTEGSLAMPSFSRQTSLSSVIAQQAKSGPETQTEATPKAEERCLTVITTFLHWRPSGCSAIRSNSAGGRIECAYV